MKRSLDISRAIMGVLAGGAVGGAAVVLFWVVAGLVISGGLQTGSGFELGSFVTIMLIAWFIATAVFWLGIVGLGVPVWALVHRIGWAGSAQAAIVGGLVTFAGSIGLLLSMGGALPEIIGPASWLALDGAMVAWLVQRIAYRPVRPPLRPARPS